MHADRYPTLSTTERAALGLNLSHFGIRLTGQDTERGTFSQRHAVVYDMHTGKPSNMLSQVHPGQDLIEVANSPLNEAAVLAFEYGHSVGSKHRALVVWEAQFGDFANNAQVRGFMLTCTDACMPKETQPESLVVQIIRLFAM
jgi:2-oxoglutarate dehydrogenase E1 component